MFDQTANNQPPSVKLVVYSSLFLVVAIIVGMVFARMIAISQSKVDTSKKAEYIAVNIDNGQREFKGKILPNFDTTIEATHRLLDQDSKLVAYITANNDILKVSEGFTVTVIGKVESTARDNIEIIKVEKIKLK